MSETKTAVLSSLKDPRLVGIGGFLLWFWVSLTVLAPLGALLNLWALIRGPIQFEYESSWAPTVRIIHGVVHLGFAGLAVYAGVLLWRWDRRGVRLAKLYLALQLAYLLVQWLPNLRFGLDWIGRAIAINAGQLIALVVWYAYLARSKRVRNTYGSESTTSLPTA